MSTTTSPARPTAGRDVGGLRRVTAQTAMELRLSLRNGESLLVTFGIPLVVLVFFSLVDVLSLAAALGQDPVQFLLPGVLALSVMSSAMVSLGIATGFERYYLVLKRLGATPLRRGELVAAKILAVLVIELVQIAVVLAVAVLALDYQPPTADPPLWLAGLAVALGTAAFAGMGLAMAGRLRAVGTLALANAVYLGLLLVGGIAIPLERLPATLAGIARLLPAAPLAGVLRVAFGGDSAGLGFDLGVLSAWAAAMVALAVIIFRWE